MFWGFSYVLLQHSHTEKYLYRKNIQMKKCIMIEYLE